MRFGLPLLGPGLVPCFPLLIASDPASTPNRRPWAPIGLRPILPPALDALRNCPAPRHRWFQSIANNPSSRHIRVPAPPSAFQLERLVESWSLPPLGPDPRLLLLV